MISWLIIINIICLATASTCLVMILLQLSVLGIYMGYNINNAGTMWDGQNILTLSALVIGSFEQVNFHQKTYAKHSGSLAENFGSTFGQKWKLSRKFCIGLTLRVCAYVRVACKGISSKYFISTADLLCSDSNFIVSLSSPHIAMQYQHSNAATATAILHCCAIVVAVRCPITNTHITLIQYD